MCVYSCDLATKADFTSSVIPELPSTSMLSADGTVCGAEVGEEGDTERKLATTLQ